MDGLPDELVGDILGRLKEGQDKLSAALTCRRFLAAVHRKLPFATAICVQFASCYRPGGGECGGRIKTRVPSYTAAVLTVCQCAAHGCTRMLSMLLPAMSGAISSLSLEDELMGGQRLTDDAAHALLNGCRKQKFITIMPKITQYSTIISLLASIRLSPSAKAHVIANVEEVMMHKGCNCSAPLSSLSFEHVDFSAVRPWTLALIASFDRLEEVHLLSCVLPEGLLLRALAASLPTLRCLSVTDSSLVSDKLCSALARGAPNLEEICIRGCRGVTAASLVPLLEAAGRRRGQQLTVRMEDTGFSSEHLERCMRSSLMPTGREWAATRMRMELGYATPALLLTHPDGKAILVYD